MMRQCGRSIGRLPWVSSSELSRHRRKYRTRSLVRHGIETSASLRCSATIRLHQRDKWPHVHSYKSSQSTGGSHQVLHRVSLHDQALKRLSCLLSNSTAFVAMAWICSTVTATVRSRACTTSKWLWYSGGKLLVASHTANLFPGWTLVGN